MATSTPSPVGSPRASLQSTAPSRSTSTLLLRSLRPEQWIKNLIVFAAALFGGQLTNLQSLVEASATFVIFCALSGAVYLFNDVADRDADQRHPLKRGRAIATGALSPALAVTVGCVLGLSAVGAAGAVRPTLGLIAAGYFALLLLYSFVLKHLVIIDALTIAGGFVLRASAGAIAIAVPIE